MPQHTAFQIRAARCESRTEYRARPALRPAAAGRGSASAAHRGRAGCARDTQQGCRRTGRRRRGRRGLRCGACTKLTDGGHDLSCASRNMPSDASTATISASGAAASSAAVDAPVPQPASSRRSPAPRSGNSHAAAQTFAGGRGSRDSRRPCGRRRRADVECGGHGARAARAHLSLRWLIVVRSSDAHRPLPLPQQQHRRHQGESEKEVLDRDVEREPDAARLRVRRRSRSGALSLVSQPSTGIWKPSTIAIDSQYAARRNRPVRNTASSSDHDHHHRDHGRQRVPEPGHRSPPGSHAPSIGRHRVVGEQARTAGITMKNSNSSSGMPNPMVTPVM